MAKQRGRSALLKINTSGSTYTTLSGCTTKSITIANEKIDVTTAPSSDTTPLWETSLSAKKMITISADGVFIDETAEETLRSNAFGVNATGNFEYVIPDFGTFKGKFHIDSLEFGGETEGAVTFSIQLTSNGAITWTSA